MVENLQPEFSDTPHVRGILSMARGDDPASASTSFFICTDVAEELDGQYTVFGVVVEGLDVVAAIERVPADDDERPLGRVELREVRVVRRD
jgi:cyclophilin family peptidyl-prolyl cis-trans isomerase